MDRFQFVVIGAGPAGEAAAFKARELDATVAVVDRLWFGGSCPRWNVANAFLSPNDLRIQVSRMPGGEAYFCVAKTVRRRHGGNRGPLWQRLRGHAAAQRGCFQHWRRECSHATHWCSWLLPP